MDILYIISIFILGLLIGFMTGYTYYKSIVDESKVGNINFDQSIPGEINAFAEFKIPVNEVMAKKYVIMEIKQENYLKENNNEQKAIHE